MGVIIGSHQTNHWAGEGALRVKTVVPAAARDVYLADEVEWSGCSQLHDIFVSEQGAEAVR